MIFWNCHCLCNTCNHTSVWSQILQNISTMMIHLTIILWYSILHDPQIYFSSQSLCCMLCIQLLAWYCRPSVCLSVTLCIVAVRVGVWGWKLYRHVPGRSLPIHFFKHFCCKMYCLARKHSKWQPTAKKTWLETQQSNKTLTRNGSSKADFSLKLYMSKHSCWPRLLQTSL